METPGHSPGSICMFTEDMAFTGDTFLNNTKSPLCFPHSNKLDYQQSKNEILQKLNATTKIFPGHGQSFTIGTK